MDESRWDVKKHIIPASHVRGYARGARSPRQPNQLRIAVNQYIPKKKQNEEGPPITVIFVHGVGSTKESYEPFFDGLFDSGLSIRSIWAADLAWHGESYVLNEHSLGDDMHWDDCARDTYHMINVFQEQMPPPIVGIGQSWGGYPIGQLALWHPRLFSALVFGEPYTLPSLKSGSGARSRERWMARKRSTWPSREEARKDLMKQQYFARFHPEVFDRVIKYDLREVPGKGGQVVSVTPNAMQVGMMVRFDNSKYSREESYVIMEKLPDIQPPVLYCFGELSDIAASNGYHQVLVETTGTGEKGNGGFEKGGVAEKWIKGAHHAMPLEKPKETAEAMVPWIKEQVLKWNNELEKEMEKPLWVSEVNPEWLEKLSSKF